jgi:hypothetical protein
MTAGKIAKTNSFAPKKQTPFLVLTLLKLQKLET